MFSFYFYFLYMAFIKKIITLSHSNLKGNTNNFTSVFIELCTSKTILKALQDARKKFKLSILDCTRIIYYKV